MKQKGFTLIELLVVIAIIAILAVTVFVALNPVQRFEDARNSRRINDINTILTAIHTCIIDSAGLIDTCISKGGVGLTASTVYELTNAGTVTGCDAICAAVTGDCTDVSDDLAGYLKELPIDPEETVANHTGYSVEVNGSGIVTVNACRAENTTITVSR